MGDYNKYGLLKMAIAWLFVGVFGASPTARAQVIDAAVCDSTDRFAITQLVSLVKTETPVSFDSLLQLNQLGKFTRAPNKRVLVLDYDPYYYTFRIIISNQQPMDKKLMLLMAPIGMRTGTLYQQQQGQWKMVGKSGIRYRFIDRPYQYTHFVFPITVPRHSVDTFFLSTDAANVYKSYGFALIKPTALKIFENKLYFYFGIIIGLLILFLLLNIYLFFALKEIIHIWYATYIGFLILIVLKNDHLDQQFLHWDTETLYRLTPLMGVGAIALAVLMHVVQLFLSNIPPKSWVYRLSLLVKWNTLVSGLLFFVCFYFRADWRILSFVFYWAEYSSLLAAATIIVACIYSIVKRFKSAYFILAGLIVFLIGVVQRLLFPSTLSFLFPPTTFHVGIIMETLIISFGLIYQYRHAKLERRLYLKKTEQLKTNFEKLLMESKAAIQEQTFKTISQEIHDNIGQVLSLVKLNLGTLEKTAQPRAQVKFNDTIDLLGKAIRDLRDLSKTLDSDIITRLGIVQAITNELKVVEKISVIRTICNCHIQPVYINPHVELILFRIVQESLHNIIKHAQATLIEVTMHNGDSRLVLVIRDNGIGFNPMQQNHDGSGLINMESRCKSIGAHFAINSASGGGTEVIITLPLHPEP